MSQAFCHACYGTSLTFENGVLVCDTCGTQTQVFQEETEFQQGIDDVRGRRRAAGAAAASQQPSQAAIIAQQEQQAATQLKDAAMLYARCLQHLLKVQGQALVSKFGCSSDLLDLLRQLWLSHIPSTGILEPKPYQALYNRTGLGTAAAGGGQQSGPEDPGGDADGNEDASDDEDREPQQQQQQQQQQGSRGLSGMRAAQLVEPHNMKRLLWKLLHPQTTLQLCFLGCVLLREAVTCYDLMGWALDGLLPFLELPHLSMAVATASAAAGPPGLLQQLLPAGQPAGAAAASTVRGGAAAACNKGTGAATGGVRGIPPAVLPALAQHPRHAAGTHTAPLPGPPIHLAMRSASSIHQAAVWLGLSSRRAAAADAKGSWATRWMACLGAASTAAAAGHQQHATVRAGGACAGACRNAAVHPVLQAVHVCRAASGVQHGRRAAAAGWLVRCC